MNKDQILEAIEKMTVLELSDLVKAIEEKFDVTANAPVMVAAAGPAADDRTDLARLRRGAARRSALRREVRL